MTLRVILNPAASADLAQLYRYIAESTGQPLIALRYVTRLRDRCERLADVPEQGTTRSDLLPGLRIIGFRRRVTIAFRVNAEQVEILRLLYGGRDLKAETTIFR
ncbi:type II toxin-antitoxin system RelE/ParE family toxin [uncultured Enterovirga sp.]|uniref:type II toxin-antitoxin system RelE/ParE family toxin n=1 Tax=uncultured Enterovirga sp. TaxID=2026352 RepID=UPI0035CB4A56